MDKVHIGTRLFFGAGALLALTLSIYLGYEFIRAYELNAKGKSGQARVVSVSDYKCGTRKASATCYKYTLFLDSSSISITSDRSSIERDRIDILGKVPLIYVPSDLSNAYIGTKRDSFLEYLSFGTKLGLVLFPLLFLSALNRAVPELRSYLVKSANHSPSTANRVKEPLSMFLSHAKLIVLSGGIGMLLGIVIDRFLIETNYSSYENCILDKMPEASTDYAAAAIEEACSRKYAD